MLFSESLVLNCARLKDITHAIILLRVFSVAAIKYLPIIVLIAIIAIYAFNRDI